MRRESLRSLLKEKRNRKQAEGLKEMIRSHASRHTWMHAHQANVHMRGAPEDTCMTSLGSYLCIYIFFFFKFPSAYVKSSVCRLDDSFPHPGSGSEGTKEEKNRKQNIC